jgi:hypothetical protein
VNTTITFNRTIPAGVDVDNPAELVVLELLDKFDQRVSTDNSTTCIITGDDLRTVRCRHGIACCTVCMGFVGRFDGIALLYCSDWTVVLCCAVLCCAVLCCAVLCCAVLCCAVL